jgi:hypothetical protein
MTRLGKLLLFLVLIASAAHLASGQGIVTGTIKGTATDPSGALVQGAQVTITNNAQGAARTSTSGADGSFSLFAVPIGTYTINVSAPGFSAVNISNVQVNSSLFSSILAPTRSRWKSMDRRKFCSRRATPRSPRPSARRPYKTSR